MTDLKKIQEAVQSYIQEGTAFVFDYIVQPRHNSAALRLQIYRNAYFLRLIDILEADYPKLSLVLGKVMFGQLVHDYLKAYPSLYYTVHQVGRDLATFMQKKEGYPDELIELARMEWTLSAVLLLENTPFLTLKTLANLGTDDWATYRFRLIKAHHVLTLGSKAARYFDLDIVDASTILVWKRQDKAYYQVLSEKEVCLINYFNQGLDFTEVCEKMNQYLLGEQGVSFIFQRIQYWINQEIFNDN